MIDKVDFMPSAELSALQLSRAESLLSVLRSNSTWMPQILAAEKVIVNRTGIDALNLLLSLPITYKSDLRRTSPMDRCIVDMHNISYIFSSSGTTGDPTLYPWSNRDDDILLEAGLRSMTRVGLNSMDLVLLLAPMGLPIMWYCMMQQARSMGATLIPLGAHPPEEIKNELSRYPISIILSSPGIMGALSEILQVENKSGKDFSALRQVQCGGSYLTRSMRKRITTALECEVYDFYGISELFGPIAGECMEKNGLHLLNDYVYIEVLDPDTKLPVPPGKIGIAVFTALWEKADPMIRYWSDDFVSLTTEPCSCGRTSPRLRFHGRACDMAVLPSGCVFGAEVEEVILGFDCLGIEFFCEILPRTKGLRVRVTVEEFPGHDAQAKDLSLALESLFELPVHINVVPWKSLQRNFAKPRRFQFYDH